MQRLDLPKNTAKKKKYTIDQTDKHLKRNNNTHFINEKLTKKRRVNRDLSTLPLVSNIGNSYFVTEIPIAAKVILSQAIENDSVYLPASLTRDSLSSASSLISAESFDIPDINIAPGILSPDEISQYLPSRSESPFPFTFFNELKNFPKNTEEETSEDLEIQMLNEMDKADRLSADLGLTTRKTPFTPWKNLT